jgi:hypothetical protein
MVFYKTNVPFNIPCKVLHPEVRVIDQTYNPYSFKYDPQFGFSGKLDNEMKEFECRAFYNGKTDVQKYDLHRKTHNTKISIKTTDGIEPVPHNNMFNIVIEKNQRLNLTCLATVGCNDIKYDLKFTTDITDRTRIITNPPNRTKCVTNFNDIAYFSKTIMFDKISKNGSQVQCEIDFGMDFKTKSPIYKIYFSGK